MLLTWYVHYGSSIKYKRMSEGKKKSEVGRPKSEVEPRELKAESTKAALKREEEHSAFDIPQSALNPAPSKSPPVGETFENSKSKNKSDPDDYQDENPQFETKEPLTTHNSPLTN